MAERAYIDFLKWSLPQLGLRWPGYRKVRRLVVKRLNRRLAELGLADLAAYRTFLSAEPAEWTRLDALCRIPISRFYRDRSVFDAIGLECLPEAAAMANARGDDAVRCWSAGCASGEEPYTLMLTWRFRVANDWPRLGCTVIATDAEEAVIERAKAACYGQSSVKDMPRPWRERAFTRRGPLFCLDAEFRRGVDLQLQDIRQAMPDGPFDVVLCRNLVFTYFDEGLQSCTLDRLRERIRPSGFLVLGSHETLPAASIGLVPIAPNLPIYRREMQPLRRS